MITLTIPARDVQIGDKLLMVDEHELRNPFVVLDTRDNWLGAEYMDIMLGAEIRYTSERAGLIRVERAETDEERQSIWNKLMSSYLSGVTWTESRYPWEYSKEAKMLIAAMYLLEHGAAPENPEEALEPCGLYVSSVLERAYASVPDEYFIIPC